MADVVADRKRRRGQKLEGKAAVNEGEKQPPMSSWVDRRL